MYYHARIYHTIWDTTVALLSNEDTAMVRDVVCPVVKNAKIMKEGSHSLEHETM